MTYEVQVQSLAVKRYIVEAETELDVRTLYSKRGVGGLIDECLEIYDGDEDEQLLSIAEAPDA